MSAVRCLRPSIAEAVSAPIPRTTLRNLGSGPTAARGMQVTYDSLSKGLPRGHPSGVNTCVIPAAACDTPI
jgi:hypothetical protein